MSENLSAVDPVSSVAIDPAHFRQVLGHFPTGVTVVTASADEGPVGLAIGSFASISLDPALVGFFADRKSGTWPLIRDSGAFCVNILREDQEEVSRSFASKSDDRFAGLGWHMTRGNSPKIEGVLAWIDCAVDSVVEVGDHDLCVGRVLELEVSSEGAPLVFFRGGYRNLQP